MSDIIDLSKDENIEKIIANQLIADFEEKKRGMDARQLVIQNESDVNLLTGGDQKRYATRVTMEMDAWTYWQIVLNSDKEFFTDEAQRRQFLKDNPQYAVKNF